MPTAANLIAGIPAWQVGMANGSASTTGTSRRRRGTYTPHQRADVDRQWRLARIRRDAASASGMSQGMLFHYSA
jgi:hypothetical protein